MSRRQLIMTTIHRMRYSALEPFFRSLRNTEFDGDVVVFCSSVDDKTIRQLEAWDALVVPFRFYGKHVHNRAAAPWWLWKRLFASNLSQRSKEKLAHFVFHLFYRRHVLYLDYLRAHPGLYDTVFLTDSRDVFFQKNPFDSKLPPGLHIFLEEETNKLGSCPHHVRWISSQFGSEMLERWTEAVVSCAGTVYGDVGSIVDYLGRMIALTMSARTLRDADGDQGIHNYLVQTASLPNVTIHSNRSGPVMTLGPVSVNSLHFDQRGRVVDDFGSVVPVLHQYDRDPALREKLLSQIR